AVRIRTDSIGGSGDGGDGAGEFCERPDNAYLVGSVCGDWWCLHGDRGGDDEHVGELGWVRCASGWRRDPAAGWRGTRRVESPDPYDGGCSGCVCGLLAVSRSGRCASEPGTHGACGHRDRPGNECLTERAAVATRRGSMKISLSGRTAVITGASRGLCEAMAKALSGAGAQIALVARDRDRMERVRSDIAGTQQTAEVFVADLTQEDQVARLAAEIKGRFGSPQILINNAG